MSNTRIILILFILSEGLGAWFSAWVLYTSKSQRDGRRTSLGLLLALACVLYGGAQIFGAFNGFKFGAQISACFPKELEVRSLVSSGVRSFSVWLVAFAFASGDTSGPFRLRVNQMLEKFR